MRRLAAALLLPALCLVTSFAAAQDAGADEVTLKNGGMIRGTVVSSEPGTSVKILEAGAKEPRTIPWSEVSDVEKGKYAPKPAVEPGTAGPGYSTPAPAAPAPAAEEAPPAKLGETAGVVRLHIDSPIPVTVAEHTPPRIVTAGGYTFGYDELKLACTSPCDKVLDTRDGHWFTAGEGMSGTRLNMESMKGDAQLDVKPGSKLTRGLGIAGTTIGGIGLAGGVVMLVIGASGIDRVDYGTGSVRHESSPLVPAGVGALVGGAVTLVAGIVALKISGTKFELHPVSAPAAAGTKPKVAKARWWMGEF